VRVLAGILPRLYVLYMRLVEATSTVDVRELRRVLDERKTDEHVALALLHQDVLALPWFFRDRRVKALAQKSDAGELIAAVLEHIGFLTARGGTSASRRRRNPVMQQMLRDAEDAGGGVVAITPDGSSGPAGVVRPGIAYFALRTRATVYCVKMSASRAVHAPTWDRTLIPLPFGELRVVVSSPLAPPDPRANVTDFERFRRKIEDDLHRLHRYAYELVGAAPVPELAHLPAGGQARERASATG
jgi:lysophospholipid acyltransferase (LPLAT)-like uncharacterized protein